jgi:hypothetical protein
MKRGGVFGDELQCLIMSHKWACRELLLFGLLFLLLAVVVSLDHRGL